MIDMNKEVIFRDGWTLDGEPLDDRLKARASEVIARGYQYGLQLVEFNWDSELIYFGWYGAKKDLIAWYTYYSVNMTEETEEKRNAVVEIIRNK